MGTKKETKPADAPSVSTARLYFEKFTGPNSLAILNSLLATHPKTFENEWLDFKSGKVQTGDIARIWSKALGAFANNEGGVIVWGIQAKKLDGVDAAHAVEPVPNVEVLASQLQEQFRFALDPPLLGVEIKPVPLSDSAKEGFVVCFVPEGTQKPHKSVNAERPFYVRVGDEAKEPSVSLLRQ